MKNWKTTIAGTAALLGIVAKVINGGALEATDLTAAIAAIGLLFAKDHNVSGGTVRQ